MGGWSAGWQGRTEPADSVELAVKPPPPTHKPPPPAHPPPPKDPDDKPPNLGYWSGIHAHSMESAASTVDDRTRHAKTRRRRSSSYTSMDGRTQESSIDLGARTMDKQTMYGSRVLLSALAVTLLWVSSLSSIGNLVPGNFPAPALTTVYHELVILVNETETLRQRYIDDVMRDLEICNASLVHATETEAQRSADARRTNEQTRNSGQATMSVCSSAHATTLGAITAWQQAQGANASSPYLPACSADDRQRLGELTGDTSSQRSATLQTAQGYNVASQGTVGRLVGQLERRADYDATYVYNRTLRDRQFDLSLNHSLTMHNLGIVDSVNGFSNGVRDRFTAFNTSNWDTLMACSTMTGGNCPDGSGVRQRVADAQNFLIDRYRSANATYTSMANTANDYYRRADASLTSVADTMTRLSNALNSQFPEVGGFSGLLPGVTLPSLISTTRVGSISLTAALPDLSVTADSTVEAISSASSAAIGRFQDNFRSAVNFNNMDTGPLMNTLTNVGPRAPPDYHPPDVNLTEAYGEQSQHSQTSSEYMQDMSVLLSLIDQANRQSNRSSASYDPIFNSNISASRLAAAATNMGWFGYQNLDDAGLLANFEWLLAPLRAISSLFSALDIVWRVFQTIRIFRRFWGRSSLAVGAVDVTTDVESKTRAGKLLSPMQATATLLTHPLVLFTLLVSFAFVIFGSAFSIYMPIYTDYQRECVARGANGMPSGDGTFLTRNAYAIAFNRASHEGNKQRLAGLDAYHLRRAEACARYGEKSANEQQQVQSEMNIIVSSHLRSQAEVRMMRSCYNTPMLDASFAATAVIDVRGEPYPPPGTTLAEVECDRTLDNSTLQDGVFDCTQLPQCVIGDEYDLSDLNGVDHTQLYSHSRVAMCTAQWWFHARVQRLGFTIFIWIFVNLFRVVLVAGVIRVSWQYLNTGFFTFTATCNSEGGHTYKLEEMEELSKKKHAGLKPGSSEWMEAVVEAEQRSADFLADKVHEMLYRMKIHGLVLITLAVLSQLPWIIAVVIVTGMNP